MRRRIVPVSAVVVLAAALLGLPSPAGGVPGSAWHTAGKQAVAVGTGGAVASMDLDASKAGITALEAGGNAVDAAVAVASTLGVTIPFVAGPGGGGFMVIYLARSHQVVTIDGRETCPRACTRTLFLDPKTGKPLPYNFANHQGFATGVPSMVATWSNAIRRYGRKSFAADLQPAIRVAQRGFRVNADFRQLTRAALPELRAYSASRALLLTPAGNPLPVGYRLRNPDLARTYQLLARHGPSYLYDGPIGRAIVRADDHPRRTPGSRLVVRPGIMRMDDLRSYAVKTLTPTHVTYRGLEVYGMAPPSSSGSTVGEALNILNGWNLGAEPRATALFHYLEASRLAYADRNAYVGDPDYVGVPLHALLSPAFAATRRCLVHHRALTSPVAPGDPIPPYERCTRQQAAAQSSEQTGSAARHTNNIVTADKWGNVVAYTNTINSFGGSGNIVPGYGFLLNDEMTDFDFAAPAPGVYDPNLPTGGKQPRSSMGGVIVLRHGKPLFTLGAAGGATIITTILQILINRVDFGMSLPAALAAPRVSQTNSPTSLAEPDFYHSAVRRQLTREFGEQFTLATGPILPLDHYPGDATAAEFLGHGLLEAVAEPVRLYGGSALVVNPRQ